MNASVCRVVGPSYLGDGGRIDFLSQLLSPVNVQKMRVTNCWRDVAAPWDPFIGATSASEHIEIIKEPARPHIEACMTCMGKLRKFGIFFEVDESTAEGEFVYGCSGQPRDDHNYY